ncbi:MAG: tRNA uracil 4-sulfurtransferase ThiI [Candidatus Tectimicrobiota bacterium]
MPEHQRYIVLHYGEVSIKGHNRPTFLRRLVRNVQHALSDFGPLEARMLSGRCLLAVPADVSWADLEIRLRHVFGLANFAPCVDAPLHMEAMKQAVSRILTGRTFRSFRITARRAFKELPFHSLTLQQELGAHVLTTHQTRVDLNHPELTVHVDIIPGRALVYVEKVPGAGGLPMGTSGGVLSLLSGGIDSPVASYRMMKRGCHVDFVHFHSYPFLDRTSQHKARQLAQLLTQYQYTGRLFLVPFGELQQRIVSTAPSPYRVILYRRYMFRIAETLARQLGAGALVTGESLGQVASQTLENLRVIEAVSGLPVLRPLIGMDKAEITQTAQAIQTFPISIQPDQDCCTLFVPRHPATRAALEAIEAAEQPLDTPDLIQLALEGMHTVDLQFPEANPTAAEAHGV